jgi:hypothetical protein
VSPGERVTLGMTAVATAAGLAAWLMARSRARREKSTEEIERQRRLDVYQRGRIAHGHIVDFLDTDSSDRGGRLLLYKYEVGGVAYEAAQDISALATVAATAHGLAGQIASVKYDPKRPTNSIIACEEWCGVGEIERLNH